MEGCARIEDKGDKMVIIYSCVHGRIVLSESLAVKTHCDTVGGISLILCSESHRKLTQSDVEKSFSEIFGALDISANVP